MNTPPPPTAAPPLSPHRDTVAMLREFLAASGLAAGDRLPGERQLMAELAAGRSSVREAVGQLAALGILDVRHGSGTYLRRPVTGRTIVVPVALEAERDELVRLVEVRMGLETEAAALAAERADRAALADLGRKLVVMEQAFGERGNAGPEDLAFHLAIYEASGNPLFGQLIGEMRGAMATLFGKSIERPDFAARSFPMHRALYVAIARGDTGEARRQVRLILDIVREDIGEAP